MSDTEGEKLFLCVKQLHRGSFMQNKVLIQHIKEVKVEHF